MESGKKSSLLTCAGWLLLMAPLAFFLVSLAVPALSNFIVSLQQSNLFGPDRFVGLKNYIDLLAGEGGGAALANSFSLLFFLRVLLLVAAPLACACLLLELRSGGRLALQVLLSPLIIYSSSVIVAIMYGAYYAFPAGWLNAILASSGKAPVAFLGDPEYLPGIVQQLLLTNGLALSLPLGIVLYLGVMRGTRLLTGDKSLLYEAFWAQVWRWLVVFLLAVTGFSITGSAGAMALNPRSGAYSDLLLFSYQTAFQRMNFGLGAAAGELLIFPLLLLGLGVILILESPGTQLSIRLVPPVGDKLLAGSRFTAVRLSGLVIAGLIILLLVIITFISFGLPWIGSISGFLALDKMVKGEQMAAFLQSLLQSLRSGLPAALLGLVSAMTAGFTLGYLKPRGSKLMLGIIGTFIFITPALLTIPFYTFFRNLELLNDMSTFLFPYLLSPFAVLLFTWFFRGIADEVASLEAGGITIDRRQYRQRVLGALVLFALPVLALYLVSLADLALFPLTMLNNEHSFTAPIFLNHVFESMYQTLGPGRTGIKMQLGMLFAAQYLLPLGLFILSLFLLFPKLAFVFRKASAPPPVLESDNLTGLMRTGTGSKVQAAPVAKALLPGRQHWLLVLSLIFFSLGLSALALSAFVPHLSLLFPVLTVPGIICGMLAYYIYVYQIHRALASASDHTYPTKPLAAVLLHFVPIFNFYWLYRWVKDVTVFTDNHDPRKILLPGLFLFIFYLSQAVFYFSLLLLFVLFGFSLLLGQAAELLTGMVPRFTVIAAFITGLIGTLLQIGLGVYMAEGVRQLLKAGEEPV